MTRRTVRALEDRGIGAIESIAPLIQRGDDLTHHSSIRTERRSGHGQAGKVGDKVWLLGLTTWLLQCRHCGHRSQMSASGVHEPRSGRLAMADADLPSFSYGHLVGDVTCVLLSADCASRRRSRSTSARCQPRRPGVSQPKALRIFVLPCRGLSWGVSASRPLRHVGPACTGPIERARRSRGWRTERPAPGIGAIVRRTRRGPRTAIL